MSLADTFSPESIVMTFRKNRICIHTVQREHTRIPAHGNDAHVTALLCRFIYIIKMLRNSCMGVKTVYNIEKFCIFRGLYRKICRTSAAENHYINLVFPLFHIRHGTNGRSLCQYRYRLRCTSCKYGHQLHVRVLLDGTLNTSSEVSIS